ncbi:MAG TPA: hypothetical protein VGP04_21335, partial [Pseudonocardiaceae bacterium]|nr:hypothetical protein [Pseudonocardiaceae bacterium]
MVGLRPARITSTDKDTTGTAIGHNPAAMPKVNHNRHARPGRSLPSPWIMFCFAWQNAPLGRPMVDSTYMSFGSHDALIDHVLETHWSQR